MARQQSLSYVVASIVGRRSLGHLKRGDQVAVMPAIGAPPDEVIEIETVNFVGDAFVQLTNGRMYAKIDGVCMGSSSRGCIVPADEQHHAALSQRDNESTNADH